MCFHMIHTEEMKIQLWVRTVGPELGALTLPSLLTAMGTTTVIGPSLGET